MDLPQNIQDMIDDFAFLGDWEERYMHVIDMGKALPALTEPEKNAANKVKGCVSQVWVVTETDAGAGTLRFRGDSDSHIVKGLVAIVIALYDNRTPAEITAIDAEPILSQLGLSEHLSSQRSNGLRAMIVRIKAIAEAAG